MKRAYSDMQQNAAPAKAGEKSPRQPKISRKIRACQECQSRKIKCGIEPGQQSCTRCQRLGLQCIVNKSLQTLLEDESEWKQHMEVQAGQLRGAVAEILRTLNLPSLEKFGCPNGANALRTPVDLPEVHVKHQSPQTSPSSNSENRRGHAQALQMAMTRENSQEPPEPETDNAPLVAAPMTSVFEVTKLRNLRSNPKAHSHGPDETILREDFISQGKINLDEADWLFRTFSGKLSAYLWGGVALAHPDLTSARASSPLLVAAILTVTALHVPGKEATFDVCYHEFLQIVSGSMFDRYHSMDDVRGLTIGAFWLSDVSWKLSGHAVRIATELNLHQSFNKVLRGDRDEVEKARLWYLLYVCDHHFSIAYGRPPVIEEDTSIACHELFLQLPGISNADSRLHSQIGCFRILSRVFSTFGPDSPKELSLQDFQHVAAFNAEFNNWRITWGPRLAPNKYVGDYPAKGVELHYHFVRLQLNSLALRGIPPSAALDLSSERRECANIAIASAISCLQMVLEEPSIRDAIVGVPLYLHTNIVFAAVFLLKMQARWKAARFEMDEDMIIHLIDRVIVLLENGNASERHLTYHVAKGLSSMVTKYKDRLIRHQEHHQYGPVMKSENGLLVPTAPGTNSGNTPQWPAMEIPVEAFGDGVDLYAIDEEYFPLDMFNLTSQMPG